MKAVIMAGGEGTRLRPLTSNAPKPMLPLANRPMMEHIITPAQAARLRRDRRHRRVPRQPHQDLLRRRQRVRRHDDATPTSRCRSAPPAASATPATLLDETFLVISGDVLTDIDLDQGARSSTASKGAVATIGLTAVDNPLEFGIVITREDGTIERFLEKPTWGQVFSDTINTGIYVLEPEIFDFIPEGRSVDFSQRGLPGAARRRQAAVRRRRRGLLGGRRHARGLPRRRTRTCSTEGRRRHPRASGSTTACGWARAPRSRRTPTVIGPAVIGPGCKIEAGCRIGEYTVLGSNVRLLGEAHDRALRAARQRLRRRRARACAARSSAAAAASAATSASTRASCSATRSSSAATRWSAATSRSTRSRRSRTARSSTAASCGRARARAACSAATASTASPTSTSRPSSRCAWRWPTARRCAKGTTVVTSRDSSRAARMLKRAMMAGLNAAGVDVLDLEVASVPVTRFLVRSPRAFGGLTVRLAPQRPRPRRRPLLRHRRHRHHRGRAAQDRAAVPARGHPPGAGRGDRRHPVPAPRARGVHRRARGHRRARRRSASYRFKLVVDYSLRRGQHGDADAARQARRRRAGRQPVRVHGRPGRLRRRGRR